MDLSEKIRAMDFQAIAEGLARDATRCARQIFECHRDDEDFAGFTQGMVLGKPKLSIVVTCDPACPLFELSFDLNSHDGKIGQYRYQTDLDLNFIDEFFVVL